MTIKEFSDPKADLNGLKPCLELSSGPPSLFGSHECWISATELDTLFSQKLASLFLLLFGTVSMLVLGEGVGDALAGVFAHAGGLTELDLSDNRLTSHALSPALPSSCPRTPRRCWRSS